jgi:integrase
METVVMRIPKYRKHSSGQARVTLGGQTFYLGKYGSPESREKYARLIAEVAASGGQNSGDAAASCGRHDLTIEELLADYWRFAKTYYSKDGVPTKELACMREALRPLRALYGHAYVRDFGPKALKAVRQKTIDSGITRGLINRRVGRIKRVFKWAVGEELVPSPVLHGLQAVAGLRYGRTDAREAEPVKPVTDEWVDAVLPHVSPHVATMIQVQRLTGMRPIELVIMRPDDIDTSEVVWVYEPYDHKNKWRGHCRRIPLGPKVQALLEPFMNRGSTDYLFSPREAEAWRNAKRRCRRTSPMTPSQTKRKPKARPKKPRGQRYTPSSSPRTIP